MEKLSNRELRQAVFNMTSALLLSALLVLTFVEVRTEKPWTASCSEDSEDLSPDPVQ